MKKSFNILLALVIAFFTLPFGGTVFADAKDYDNIKDGEYTIGIESPEESADNFLLNKANLSIQGEDITLTVAFDMDIDMDFYIDRMTLDEKTPIAENEDDRAQYFTFQLDAITSTFPAQMTYVVPDMLGPGMDFVHEDVDFRIVLDENDLGNLPVTEDESGDDDSEGPGDENGDDDGDTDGEEPTEAPDERVVDELLTEKEADAVYELDYETDSRATAGQLKNPVKLLEKGNKEYVQIEIEDRGAPLFRSLKINGKEVTWNSITEGPYVIQFELPNGIDDELDVSMVIQAGPNVMPHDGIKLWFDKDSLEAIKEPKPEKIEIKQGTETPVKANDTIIVKDSYDTQLTMPKDLSEDVKVTITSSKDKVENEGDLEIAGDVLEFDFENLEGYEGNFELVMEYDQEKYNSDEYDVDIYYYNEEKEEWIAQNGTAEDGKITIKVDHFSTYGVFAKEVEEPKEDPKGEPKEEDLLTPDKAYEIDYVVKHVTNDEPSAADNFFEKPGKLLEKDGVKYLQLTINNWEMIDWLKANGKDVDVIKVNKDGSALIQLKIDRDLTDVIMLNMHITVPGMYSMEHDARLILDSDSMKEKNASEYTVFEPKESNGRNGDNGDPTPEKPTFGDNGDDNGQTPKNKKDDNTDNPKTGDTSTILLYTLLLIGSLIPLGVKLKRRFV